MKVFAKDKDFYNKLNILALPIIFQHLMLASVAVADAFMLGNVEQNAMSSVSLATQIQFVQNMIMTSALSAASVLAAQYWGKGDKDTVNDIFRISVRVCGLISILTFLGCELCPGFLMSIFTNEPILVEIGSGYLKIAGWSYLLTGISQCYLNTMKVTEHAKETAIISSTTVIINVVLNAVLIYGLLGFNPMGVEGAACATLIARIVEIVFVVVISFKDGYMRLHIEKLFTWKKLLAIDFIKCALPLIGAALFWGIGFTSYTAFMGHLGMDAAAANSVTAVIRDLVCCTCDGISIAGGIVVGNALGAGNLELGKLYGDRLVIIAFIVGILSTLVMFIITPFVLDFVILTEKSRYLLKGMMYIMSVYMIGRAVNSIIINGIFAAGGDTLFDMYSLAVCMWCLAIPLAALGTFVFHWSVFVIYACTCLDEVGKIPWVMHHYKKYKWVKDLTREF